MKKPSTKKPSDKMEHLVEENQQLANEIKRWVDQLSAINSVAAAVSQSLDLEKTLETALQVVLDIIHVDATGISLIDRKTNELVLRAQRGWKRDFVKMGMRMPAGHGLSWHVIEHDEVVVTGDVARDSRIEHPAFQEEGVKAQALAPMHAHGSVIGILSAMHYSEYQFQEEQLTVLSAIADQVGVALDNARLFNEISTEKDRLRAIMDSTADAIIAIRPDGTISNCNAGAEELLSVRAQSVIDRQITESGLDEALVHGLHEAAEQHQRSPQKFEVTIRRPPITTILGCVISPVEDESDTLQGWVAVLRDVTHLRAADDLKTQVIQTAAHDIRSPIGATETALNMLRDSVREPTPVQHRMFEAAYEGLHRVYRLIDNLLNIEKIEGGLTLDDTVDMGHLVSQTLQDLDPGLVARTITFGLEIADPLPMIKGSEVWLERAMSNYISNAIKYTPEGGKIRVRLYLEDTDMVFEVEDNGPGIPLDAQARLFERFYRVAQQDDGKRKRGSGLGLSIVKLVIEQHGGRVYVRSQPGAGSTFGFALPLPA